MTAKLRHDHIVAGHRVLRVDDRVAAHLHAPTLKKLLQAGRLFHCFVIEEHPKPSTLLQVLVHFGQFFGQKRRFRPRNDHQLAIRNFGGPIEPQRLHLDIVVAQ